MKAISMIQLSVLLLYIALAFSLSHAGQILRMNDELNRIREFEIEIESERIREFEIDGFRYNIMDDESLRIRDRRNRERKLNEIYDNMNIKKRLNLLKKKILHIPHVKFRIAVFAYEDPWNTGLGNTLATLMAGEILFNSAVYSLGVLTYEGDLKSNKFFKLSYFDKVEKITKYQDITISLWGRIIPKKDLLVIDTNIQISKYSLDNYFSWNLKLPEAMGGESLQAHLRPDRIKLQRFKLKKELKPSLIESAERLKVLHEKPDDNSKIVAKIPLNHVYTAIRKKKGGSI